MALISVDPDPPPVCGLDHSAYRCREAEETRGRLKTSSAFAGNGPIGGGCSGHRALSATARP
jgi:hypothetical protein